jgi:uncharacterized membrane protein YkoI
MKDKIKGVGAAIAAVAALGGDETSSPQATPAAAAQSAEPAESQEANEGPDQPIGGSDLDKASAAALAHTGGGQVTGTEVGDEQSYYEVEVTRDDGTQVDVQLDRSFQVVGGEVDEE